LNLKSPKVAIGENEIMILKLKETTAFIAKVPPKNQKN